MTEKRTQPIIVGFVADLMFTMKIANVARHSGFEMKWIETAVSLGDDEASLPEPLGESLYGRTGHLFEQITQWQPALLLFDLNNDAIPWRQWLPSLKSSPATKRIPIMAFGSHKDVETMQDAKRLGADFVYARSRFTSAMPQLFQKCARVPDYAALTDFCERPLPPLAQEGIELFNQGQYYQCHDALEEAWRQEKGPGRDLYQGILQIGVACYQILQENYRGAVKMFLRARQWLEPLPDQCQGVNIARLRANAAEIYDSLTDLGPDRIEEFDPGLIKEIEIQ
ncbi:MAG: DUF309 domain-containing protein [Chloroflexi bacterium]|nr:DUF309 domain-containing protein [Chloroflexota bacterium]